MARVNSMFKSPFYPSPNRPNPYSSPPHQSTAVKPKVISVPVKFADSNKNVTKIDPSNAAIKIQKIFRGFLVRKNLKTVRKIEEEVNEIELKLKRDEDIDRIVRVEKERLQIGEMLMRLLFRLDSVRGVRDYRKKVIRKVISIQEVLDSIASGHPTPANEETKSVITEEANACHNQVNESNNTEIMDQDVEDGTENVIENKDEDMADSVDLSECKIHAAPVEKLKMEESAETAETERIDLGWEFLEMNENGNDNKNEKRKIENEDDGEVQNIDYLNGNVADSENDHKKQKMEAENERLKIENEEMKNIMETMISENAKLKELVAELCKSSAQQCTLMGEIADRVENLEKTVKKMKTEKKDAKIKEVLRDQNLQ